MEVQATPLVFNLSEEEMLKSIGDDMVARFREAVRTTRAKPKDSTIKRRGRGDFFNVTGTFLSGVTWKMGSQGDLHIIDKPDRLGPGRRQYLHRRIKNTRPERILDWLRRTGRLRRMLREEVIESGFTRKGTGIPKGRLGGIIRTRR